MCHLTNSSNSALSPESTKQKARKAPLINYPQGPPPEYSSPSEPRPPTSETNSNSTRSASDQSVLPYNRAYSGPEGCVEQSTRAYHLPFAQAEASDFLPKGEWYEVWLAESRFNPRRDKPMSDWLSDWEKDFENLE
ncbi:hypothetical protein JMJ35_007920 [Cladonia borealis]|uniref:Uncharacterized protein n=1 Tax=Cladonia borealis TaxID=184061 RepID=A0AA39QX98_9LECA|nr:hypothetical protein JMJ35_007920 [Cladonia borealis]